MHPRILASLCLSLALSILPAIHAAEHQNPASMVGAHAISLEQMEISRPWSRALPPNAHTGAAFVQIKNLGEQDLLLGASSDIAETVELHAHVQENGLLKMVRVKNIEIPAGGILELQPGGHHIMLVGLRQPLREGGHFLLQLEFARAGKIELEAEILGLDAGSETGHSHH